MNDLSTIVNRVLKSNLNNSSVKVYLYLYCNASKMNKSSSITNGELTKELRMNIKTVLRSLAQLREFGYIEVGGKTSNRVMHCIDPYLINSKTIREKQLFELNKAPITILKSVRKISDTKKLELDKWYFDYNNDTDLGIKISDIYCYLKKRKIEISNFTKKLIFKNSDPLTIPGLDKIHFKNYINHRRQKEITENFIEKRAFEYDSSHKNQIQKDLRGFYLHREHRNKFAEYINCSYNKLSKYSIEFKKAFLSWIGPEFF